MKKYQIMINNIRFKIIAGKINKILEFYTIFARKMPDYIIRHRDRGQAEAKTSRPRPKFWPRGHFGFEDLTSLVYRGRRYENNDIFPKSVHTFAAVTSGRSVEHRQ